MANKIIKLMLNWEEYEIREYQWVQQQEEEEEEEEDG